ncbi:glycosyltransferase family 4 protein [Kytococcus sedentarius]|uniref:D-inositol 3-phosphate glycosyltransferase n=1 Tax=Kytococcus sedentarius (strain ATCC 14392 / DSM 20547 / JCM 11482 / CCUG 33030 / NBRC 15357 / NCTC 11040 / CCM 314 / 541) TaxID=478801 RepID=C7NJT0_KYTSD|nr:glycosyltransferase family 4 protein [Kytococcus sedentarius]ACV06862.1 glycosyltransferase [Kytococcus sedentarius DSM 20547]QQB62880.1 glycosyltransferase family 4 protein [Kytococcus sedentarius]STX14313.1 putative glycosyl transferase [Kytococcus sedentarius]
MKIGIISHWYDPEGGAAAGPGTIARALRDRGHDVHVVTGFPIYPRGEIFEGYRNRPYQREVLEGVTVHRCAIYPSHDTSAAKRMANYLSFAASSSVVAPKVLGDVDVCYVYSSPVTTGFAAMALRSLRGVPYVMHVQDLWPDSVTASGFVGGRKAELTEKALHAACTAMYRSAAHVAVISPGMRTLLAERGAPLEKTSVVPNWAEERSFYPAERSDSRREALGITSPFTVMYAGNHGEMQNLWVVLDAAERLLDDPRIGFALVGDGVLKQELVAAAEQRGLHNITFIEPQPFSEMAAVLACADAQIVSLKDEPLYRTTTPSKIQANLAAGQPIIAALTGDAAEVVRASGGTAVAPGDAAGLASGVQELASLSPEQLAARGQRARAYYDSTFSERSVGDALEGLLAEHRRKGLS